MSAANGAAGAAETAPQVKARKLRKLAKWYRSYAERAGNPAIWDARLRTADDLDAEASSLERQDGGAARRDWP